MSNNITVKRAKIINTSLYHRNRRRTADLMMRWQVMKWKIRFVLRKWLVLPVFIWFPNGFTASIPVDVITGIIKSQCSLSYCLCGIRSGTDPRTIIDANGAEKDMLYMPMGNNQLHYFRCILNRWESRTYRWFREESARSRVRRSIDAFRKYRFAEGWKLNQKTNYFTKSSNY